MQKACLQGHLRNPVLPVGCQVLREINNLNTFIEGQSRWNSLKLFKELDMFNLILMERASTSLKNKVYYDNRSLSDSSWIRLGPSDALSHIKLIFIGFFQFWCLKWESYKMIVTALPSWEKQTGNRPSQAKRRSSRACPWPDVCPASKGFQRAVTDSSPGHALEVRPASARSQPARENPCSSASGLVGSSCPAVSLPLDSQWIRKGGSESWVVPPQVSVASGMPGAGIPPERWLQQ